MSRCRRNQEVGTHDQITRPDTSSADAAREAMLLVAASFLRITVPSRDHTRVRPKILSMDVHIASDCHPRDHLTCLARTFTLRLSAYETLILYVVTNHNRLSAGSKKVLKSFRRPRFHRGGGYASDHYSGW